MHGTDAVGREGFWNVNFRENLRSRLIYETVRVLNATLTLSLATVVRKAKRKGWPPPEVRAPGSYLFIKGGPSAGHATWLINRRATSCDWVARLSLVCALVRMRVRRAGYACIGLTGPSSPPSVPPPPQTPLSRRCAGAVLLPALALRLSGSCIARRDREACGRDGGG